MTKTIPQLVQAANEAATAGRFQEAERHWNEVRRLEPRHPKALFSLGFHALQRGDVGGALELLTAAREVAPGRPRAAVDAGRGTQAARRCRGRVRSDPGGPGRGRLFSSGPAREGELDRAQRKPRGRGAHVRERTEGGSAADALAGEPEAAPRARAARRRAGSWRIQRVSRAEPGRRAGEAAARCGGSLARSGVDHGGPHATVSPDLQPAARPAAARDPVSRSQQLPVARGDRGQDRRHPRGTAGGARVRPGQVQPLHHVQPRRSGQPVAGAQPFAALERAEALGGRTARPGEHRALPGDREGDCRAAARGYRRAVPQCDVLGARAEDAHSAASRRDERAPGGAPAAHRAGEVRDARRLRDAGVEGRRGADPRRHDRARGDQRQRRTARRADLRSVESAPCARRAGDGPRNDGCRPGSYTG